MTELAVEMQMRCVHCGREQYAPAVMAISHGKDPCCWCGKFSKPMSTKEYRTIMKKQYEERV